MHALTPLRALPGAGISPQIFDGLSTPGYQWQPVDWFSGQGPFDPVSVADRLALQLNPNQNVPVLVGHSLGAFIALLIAIRHPQRVKALIVSNTGAHTQGHGDPSLPQKIRTDWGEEARRDFLSGCFHYPPAPLIWTLLSDYLRDLPGEHLLQAVLGLRALDIRADLVRIQCPTLVAHGRFDRRRDVEAASLLANKIPKARRVLLPGGHTPMLDCRTEYQATVNEFLAALPEASLRST
jgi:pimeloyl-ACP methyl ester carboxylesterase